jgi:hypothetical protein
MHVPVTGQDPALTEVQSQEAEWLANIIATQFPPPYLPQMEEFLQ